MRKRRLKPAIFVAVLLGAILVAAVGVSAGAYYGALNTADSDGSGAPFRAQHCLRFAPVGAKADVPRTSCTVASTERVSADGASVTVVTSFYPMYIAAMNICEGIAGVDLQNLSEPQTGCLHDYQLTPSDMTLLSTADIFIINGSGIEEFLTDVAEEYPDLTIVDASEGISLLEEEDDEDEADGDFDEADAHEGIGDHEHEVNSHIWMSIPRYRKQVQNIAAGLMVADKNAKRREAYETNAGIYDKKLAELETLRHGDIPTPVIIFHEAFAYLADDFGMDVVGVMDLDEERQISAKEVADIIEIIREKDVQVILAEEQYGKEMGDLVSAETGVTVLYLDTIVRAENNSYNPDAYLDRMKTNIETIENEFIIFD